MGTPDFPLPPLKVEPTPPAPLYATGLRTAVEGDVRLLEFTFQGRVVQRVVVPEPLWQQVREAG